MLFLKVHVLFHIYPDENHDLLSVRRHLYRSMDKFWTKRFPLNGSEFVQPDPEQLQRPQI